jgi:hypothetical protein
MLLYAVLSGGVVHMHDIIEILVAFRERKKKERKTTYYANSFLVRYSMGALKDALQGHVHEEVLKGSHGGELNKRSCSSIRETKERQGPSPRVQSQ